MVIALMLVALVGGWRAGGGGSATAGFVASASPSAPLPLTAASLLSHDDLVVAMPTSTARHELVEGTRQWRHGLRAVVVTNSSAQAVRLSLKNEPMLREKYAHYADEEPPVMPGGWGRGGMRAAWACMGASWRRMHGFPSKFG
jgi:hypothetical protein